MSSVISMAEVRSGLRSDQEAEDGHQPRVLHCPTLLIISIQLRVYIHISYGSDSFSERTETLEARSLQGDLLFMTILAFRKG